MWKQWMCMQITRWKSTTQWTFKCLESRLLNNALPLYCLLNQVTQIDKDCDTYNEYICHLWPRNWQLLFVFKFWSKTLLKLPRPQASLFVRKRQIASIQAQCTMGRIKPCRSASWAGSSRKLRRLADLFRFLARDFRFLVYHKKVVSLSVFRGETPCFSSAILRNCIFFVLMPKQCDFVAFWHAYNGLRWRMLLIEDLDTTFHDLNLEGNTAFWKFFHIIFRLCCSWSLNFWKTNDKTVNGNLFCQMFRLTRQKRDRVESISSLLMSQELFSRKRNEVSRFAKH